MPDIHTDLVLIMIVLLVYLVFLIPVLSQTKFIEIFVDLATCNIPSHAHTLKIREYFSSSSAGFIALCVAYLFLIAASKSIESYLHLAKRLTIFVMAAFFVVLYLFPSTFFELLWKRSVYKNLSATLNADITYFQSFEVVSYSFLSYVNWLGIYIVIVCFYFMIFVVSTLYTL